MEGEGSKPLPQESASKGSSTKLIVAIIVVILVVAAVAGALLLMGGGETVENKAPTASLTVSANEVNFGQAVTFNGAGSSDPDGTIAKYIWQFGDGKVMETATSSVDYIYGLPGQYMAVLTVVDDKGATGNSWGNVPTVLVDNPAPTLPATNSTEPFAFAAVSNALVDTNTAVNFDGNSSFGYELGSDQPSSGASILAMSWNFGDGSAIQAGSYADVGFVSHTFTGNGTIYTVTLTVISTHGAIASYAITVGVKLKGGSTPSGGVTNPDTFTYATIGEPQSLDPAWDYESAGGQILQNVYETLVYYDREKADTLIPVLAKEVPSLANGLVSSDGLHYTFNLRTDVKFHDGTTMTADDVIYSIERAMVMNDAEGAAWMLAQIMVPGYTGLGSVVNWDDVNASMTKVNNSAVTFNLITPYPAFLFIMAYNIGSVVSKNYVEAHGGIVPNEKNDWMNRHEMGTGPFFLKEWAPNQYVKMQRWDSYWQEPAKLKYVVVKKVQDLGTRKMLLFNGQADAIYVPVMFKSDVENKPNVFTQDMLPTFSLTFFGFNQDIVDGGTLEVGDVPTSFFSDLNVRQAFVHAFDYNKYLEVATLNTAVQPTGPIPQGMFGYDPTIPLVTFDLSLTAEYLKKALDTRTADATDTYADNGFTIWLYYNAGNLGRQTGCELLKANLEKLSQNATAGVNGKITVNVQALDWPTYLNARADRWLPVFFLGWSVDYPDPDDFANPFCHENGSFPIYLGLVNHSLTQLVQKAAIELNVDLREKLYSDIGWSCYYNAYYIYASQPTNFAVLRTWVQGYYYNPTWSDVPTLFYPLYKSLTPTT